MVTVVLGRSEDALTCCFYSRADVALGMDAGAKFESEDGLWFATLRYL